ncbi:Transcriptional regulatory protein OmpR [Methylobrevis pamukkalensis]|uniref:Regulatory protein VirG n=1 Tax=Methylobrevis pamukkalensis TaxID=1439726 RepID=A0A1E3H4R1_9HYPH|nr:Transcriptional regulatory protein OmpR [Methylobrevis pamukkalensis]
MLAAGPVDLVVLDLMLPGEGGLSICRRLRRDKGPPILMLTALGEDIDRIVGLETGADDYLVKPFNPRELLARIRAVLRRWEEPVAAPPRDVVIGGQIQFDRWTVDLLRRQLYDVEGVRVSLTSGEFDLLVTFCRHAGQVLARDTLLEITRGRASGGPYDRSIDIMVSRLRRKLQSESDDGGLINTVRNVGYVFSAQVREKR